MVGTVIVSHRRVELLSLITGVSPVIKDIPSVHKLVTPLIIEAAYGVPISLPCPLLVSEIGLSVSLMPISASSVQLTLPVIGHEQR